MSSPYNRPAMLKWIIYLFFLVLASSTQLHKPVLFIELLTHFVPYYLLALLGAGLYGFIKKNYLFSTINTVTILIIVVLTIPYSFFFSSTNIASSEQDRLQVAYYNANRKSKAATKFLKQAKSNNAHLACIAEAPDYVYKNIKNFYDNVYYRGTGLYGMACYTDYTIRDFSSPSSTIEGKAPWVTGHLQINKKEVSFQAVHAPRPSPFQPFLFTKRNKWLDKIGTSDTDIVLGDLNATVFTPYMSTIEKNWKFAGAVMMPTWPSIPLLTIDHILYQPSLDLIEHQIGSSYEGDHYSVWASFIIKD